METNGQKFLFWLVYLIAAAVAAYHSATVFLMSDPWFIAIPAAIAVDGLTAYSLSVLGRWKGDQRLAGFIGIILFVIISGFSQVISRFAGMGMEIPEWINWVSLALVPLSSTGAVVVLGGIHYFSHQGEPIQKKIEVPKTTESSNHVLDSVTHSLSSLAEKVSDVTHAVVPKRRGRPPKVYAKDVPAPKA